MVMLERLKKVSSGTYYSDYESLAIYAVCCRPW